MKLFLMTIILLMPMLTRADDSDIPVPPALKGGTITITTKSGKKYSMPADEYAVVLRKQKGPKTFYLTKEVPAPTRRNAIKVFGGVGPAGPNVSTSTGGYEVKQGYGANAGIGVEHDLSDKVSIDVIGVGNSAGPTSGLVGVGYRF